MFVIMVTRTFGHKTAPYTHAAAIRATKELAIARMKVLVQRAVDEGCKAGASGNGWMNASGTDEGKPFIDTYTVEQVIDCAS